MYNYQSHPKPTTGGERISTLDSLRGLAVLGILIMNIQSFAMVEAAYLNPMAYGDMTGLNRLTWIFSNLFADHKFMNLFSILYGAGIVLFSTRMEERGHHPRAMFVRRSIFLFLFGIIHGFGVWFGDILTVYALVGLAVYPFRKQQPAVLVFFGTIALLVPTLLFSAIGLGAATQPEAAAFDAAVIWQPSQDMVDAEVATYRGGWLTQMEHRATTVEKMLLYGIPLYALWRVGGIMLLGMALFRWGVLSGTRSRGFYLKLAGVCLALGLVLGGFGLFRQMVEGFPYVASKFFYRLFIYWGSIPQSVGYAAVLILISRHRLVRKWLEPAGRMAFSNYLGQSLLCTAIFYGHGFGLFGKVERFPLLLLVLAIWMLQLLVSRAWLRRFRFGPAEWLWRSLTYGKIQTLKRPGNDGALQGDMMRNMPVAVQQDPRFGPTRDMIAQFRALFDDEPEVMDALMVMIRVHLHQKDRPDGSPYVSHPLQVALQVVRLFEVQHPDIIIAALLHDSVEDQPQELCAQLQATGQDPLAAISDRFGERVSQLVAHLTNPDFYALARKAWTESREAPDEGTLAKARRRLYREHVLALFNQDPDAAMIKLCDFGENALKLNLLEEGPVKDRLRAKYGPVILAIVAQLSDFAVVDHPLYTKRWQIIENLSQVYREQYAKRSPTQKEGSF